MSIRYFVSLRMSADLWEHLRSLARTSNLNTVPKGMRSVNCSQQKQQVLVVLTYLNASFMRQARQLVEYIFSNYFMKLSVHVKLFKDLIIHFCAQFK